MTKLRIGASHNFAILDKPGRYHFFFGGSVFARAVAVCLARKSASLAANDGSLRASHAMANSAALAAPASPIAKVATGMPLGICTVDSSESSPRRYFDGIGTPSTGNMVFAAR